VKELISLLIGEDPQANKKSVSIRRIAPKGPVFLTPHCFSIKNFPQNVAT